MLWREFMHWKILAVVVAFSPALARAEYCDPNYKPIGERFFGDFYGGDSVRDVICKLSAIQVNEPAMSFKVYPLLGSGSRRYQLSSHGRFGIADEIQFDTKIHPVIEFKSLKIGGIDFEGQFLFHNASPEEADAFKLFGFAEYRLRNQISLTKMDELQGGNLSEHLYQIHMRGAAPRKDSVKTQIFIDGVKNLAETMTASLRQRGYVLKGGPESRGLEAHKATNYRVKPKASSSKIIRKGKTADLESCSKLIAEKQVNYDDICDSFIDYDKIMQISLKYDIEFRGDASLNFRYGIASDDDPEIKEIMKFTDAGDKSKITPATEAGIKF